MQIILIFIMFFSFSSNANELIHETIIAPNVDVKIISGKTERTNIELFYLVEKLSLANETPNVEELNALLDKYININDGLNKMPSYDSSIVKFMMSESILNGVVYNLVTEVDALNTEKACGFLDSSKELFVDVMYNVSVM